MQTTSVKNIDNKHGEWANSLGFYKDELKIFTERLREVAAKNTALGTMQLVEHFQNQFLIQSENIDILQHDIHQHVSILAIEVLQHAALIDRHELASHLLLKERVEKEADIFKNLKAAFMGFLSRVM